MNPKTRIFLFATLVLLFLIVVPLTILYSLGWRIDWSGRKIIQEGAFYFKVLPRNAQIYLDSKFQKKTDFFFGSALIENLLPKPYTVEVRKEGFQSWKKTLDIKARQVTEAKNIVLFPDNIAYKILARNTTDVFFTPDNRQVILKENYQVSPNTQNQSHWALKLFDLSSNVKSNLANEQDFLFPRTYLPVALRKNLGANLLQVRFSPNASTLILQVSFYPSSSSQTTGAENNVAYYLLYPRADNPHPIFLSLLDSQVQDFAFNPQDQTKLLILKKGKLYQGDLESQETLPLSFSQVVGFGVWQGNVYYLEDSGMLFKTNTSLSPASKEPLLTIPFAIKNGARYQVISTGPQIFLKENNILYHLKVNTGSFEKLQEGIVENNISPDLKRIAVLVNNKLYVFFLEKLFEQPPHEAGDQALIAHFSEKISNISWITDHYLIFTIADEIKIAETDDRDIVNIINLRLASLDEFTLKQPRIFWDQDNKKLYMFSNGILAVTEKLVP